MKNWRQWFEWWGDSDCIRQLFSSGDKPLNSTTEEMYQAFKDRLIEELRVDAAEWLKRQTLIDITKYDGKSSNELKAAIASAVEGKDASIQK